MTKTFAPAAVFQGQDDNVTVRATNSGSLPLFNVSLSTSPDPFDTAVSGSLDQQYAVLNSSVSQSLNYTVKMLTPGNHTSASTSITYVFGGVSTPVPRHLGQRPRVQTHPGRDLDQVDAHGRP